MKRTALVLAAAIAAVSATSPALAEGVVRPGDASLSCEALSSEVSTLEEAQARRAQRAESGRKFMGFAGSALLGAAPGLIARADASNETIIAQSALRSMQSHAASMPASEPKPDTSPQAKRLEHVRGLIAERGC